jgi:hypothetical protein
MITSIVMIIDTLAKRSGRIMHSPNIMKLIEMRLQYLFERVSAAPPCSREPSKRRGGSSSSTPFFFARTSLAHVHAQGVPVEEPSQFIGVNRLHQEFHHFLKDDHEDGVQSGGLDIQVLVVPLRAI